MDVLNRAFKEFFEGNIDEAERIVERMKKRLKKSYRLWLLDALIKLRRNKPQEALQSIDKGLDLKADEAELWVVKGKIHLMLNENESALKAYKRAYDITLEKEDYMDYEVMIDMAKALLELDRVREAEKLVDELKELVPEDDDLVKLMDKLKEVKGQKS